MKEKDGKILCCGAFPLPLNRPLIMGIVNLAPDSFSGDGVSGGIEAALSHARTQWEAGADILDLGAESTRPGANPTPLQEELSRLLPVLEAIRKEGWDVPISIDTYKPEVMKAALDAGADMINDINALRAPGALDAVVKSSCGICLMHMQGMPRNMQQNPVYADVNGEVHGFFAERVNSCRVAGIADDRLLLDPGFGFGKTLAHNLSLFKGLPELSLEGLPLLVGVCRKRMIGELTGKAVAGRMAGSLAAAVVAAEKMNGKAGLVIRVHDVAATKDALTVWQALQGEAVE